MCTGGVIPRRPEAAVAVAKQYADRGRRLIGADEIEMAVAIKIVQRHRLRPDPGGEVVLGAEGAGTGPQKHAD